MILLLSASDFVSAAALDSIPATKVEDATTISCEAEVEIAPAVNRMNDFQYHFGFGSGYDVNLQVFGGCVAGSDSAQMKENVC